MTVQHVTSIIVLVAVLVTFVTTSPYDRCIQENENTVIIKFKGGGSIKLVRKGDNIYLHQKSADEWRWLSNIEDRQAMRMILKFVKMGQFSGCRRHLFTPRKPTVMKKPRKLLFRNAWFF